MPTVREIFTRSVFITLFIIDLTSVAYSSTVKRDSFNKKKQSWETSIIPQSGLLHVKEKVTPESAFCFSLPLKSKYED